MDVLEKRFNAAFESYSDELFRHASMRLSERERAVELTQECFMKAWNYAKKGGEVREWRPFLFQTLRNLIIDEYRKKKAVSLESLLGDENESSEILLPPDESNTLNSAMDRLDGGAALERLKDLPILYGEVLSLRFVESLSPREIAEIVGETENVVSVRIHRGLKKLRELLEQHSSNKTQNQ